MELKILGILIGTTFLLHINVVVKDEENGPVLDEVVVIETKLEEETQTDRKFLDPGALSKPVLAKKLSRVHFE